MTEITKENFASNISDHVRVIFMPFIADIITSYVTPPNPTDYDIGKYSIEDLLHTLQDIDQCFRGIGESFDAKFVKRAIRMAYIIKKRREIKIYNDSGEILFEISEKYIENDLKRKVMIRACIANNITMVDHMLDDGIKPTVGIYEAYMNGRSDLTKYLFRKGAPYSCIWANICHDNDIKMAQFMIDNNPNKIDEMIQGACWYTALDIINLLIDNGADIKKAIDNARLCDQKVLDLLNSRMGQSINLCSVDRF